MEFRSRVDHHLRNFDVYDITCPICMSVFQNPVIVCKNGHSLCSVCHEQCRQNPGFHLDCPHCKVKMLGDPIVNRVAQCSVTWFFRTLQEVVPYTKDDRVDLNLTKFINHHTDRPSIPPFLVSHNNPWVVGIIQDIDTVQLEYVVVPDIRPDLLKGLCINNNNAYAIRVSFADCNQVLAPYGAYSESWRNLDWINENNISYFYVCPSLSWTTGIRLWDRKGECNKEWVLLGFESNDGLARDVCWYDLEDTNLHPVATDTTPPHTTPPALSYLQTMYTDDNHSDDESEHDSEENNNPFQIHLNNSITNHPPSIQTILH